jgi:hypothetical protein
MPRLSTSTALGNTPPLTPPCATTKADAHRKTRSRSALLREEDPVPSSSPKATSRTRHEDRLAIGWRAQGAWDRADRPLRAALQKTPNPLFFQSFSTLRVYQTTLPCQPPGDVQIPVEADDSARIREVFCTRGRTPPATGKGVRPAPGSRRRRSVWNQYLSAISCVWGAASRCDSSGELLQF